MGFHVEEDTFSKRLDWRLWRQVCTHVGPHRRLFISLAASAVALALLDAAFALITRSTIDRVAAGTSNSILAPAIGYVVLTVLFAVGVWVFIDRAGGISHHVSHDIRRAGFARLQELEMAFFDRRPAGWLISRLTADCDKLARIIAWGLLDLLWASVFMLAAAAILFVWHWKLALLTFTVVPPLLLVSAWFQKRMLLSARETRRMNSMITASFAEGLAGLRTTRSLVRESENLHEFERLAGRMFSASLRNARQSAIYMPIVLTLGAAAGAIALWYGGGEYIRGHVTPGTLVAFLFFTAQFFHPVNAIANALVQMQGAQAAGERVLGLLATEPRIKDSPTVRERLAQHRRAPRDPGLAPDGFPAQIRQIEFRDVDFSYDDGAPVLTRFNLTVHAGQMVALVGPSGGGKTTIVNLASRLYEPTGGQILFDGIDYRERSLAWLQSNLGIVLQQPHLFSGTIRENIRYGRLDARDEEIAQAARLVNAESFILSLEHGYDSEVGEGGGRLSTGQKQLISFARAILAHPQIFIMDEATSSIDTETEQLIQAALTSVFAGRLSFVIAHRLSTVRSADLILVIDRGRIEERGTHAELMRAGGHYHQLYTSQLRREQERAVLDLSDDQASGDEKSRGGVLTGI